ncbi:hypothetical protein CHS0354_012885 [Potamilus streckersoni]|uniref:Uncharacterized protein n=1 Tax=Potamilus streckersoni TaxID=2493646 RepID=A0AAE0RQA7_9BIVA|nr:hypothetical protein CHS0354_012885 [Potamilus streckersoni]
MRCEHCGAEEEVGENTGFCSQCGHEFKVKKNIIFCRATLKDGTTCKAEIEKKFRFCKKCGTEVDPQWFHSSLVTCCGKGLNGSICGNTLDKEDEFCYSCGTQKPTEETDPVTKTVREVLSETVTEVHSAETDLRTEEPQMIFGPSASLTCGEYSSLFSPFSIQTATTVKSHSDGSGEDEVGVESSEVDGQKPSSIDVNQIKKKKKRKKKKKSKKELLPCEDSGDKYSYGNQENVCKEVNKGIEMQNEVHDNISVCFAGKIGIDAKNNNYGDVMLDFPKSDHEEKPASNKQDPAQEQEKGIEDLKREALTREMTAHASNGLDISVKGGAMISKDSFEEAERTELQGDRMEARPGSGQKLYDEELTLENTIPANTINDTETVGKQEAQEPTSELQTSVGDSPKEGKRAEEKSVQEKATTLEVEITNAGGQKQEAESLEEIDKMQTNERGEKEEVTAAEDDAEDQMPEDDKAMENDDAEDKEEDETATENKSVEDDHDKNDIAEGTFNGGKVLSKKQKKRLKKKQMKERKKKIEASQRELEERKNTKKAENAANKVWSNLL